MRKIYCDICEAEQFHTGIQQAERTVTLVGKQEGSIEILLTIRAESEREPDICNKCIIASLQGVDDMSPLSPQVEPENAAWCGHERAGYVEAGNSAPGYPHAMYSCCDRQECKTRLIQKASEDTGGHSAFFYRDTIGG